MTTLADERIKAVRLVTDALNKSQWLPEAEIKSKRNQRLIQILHHAKNTVPHYREIFADVEIPSEITPEFWQSLPVTTRHQIKHSQQEIISDTVTDDIYTYPAVTSGTTGISVRILGTFETMVYWNAMHLREHFWHDRNFNHSYASIRRSEPGYGLVEDDVTANNWGSATENFSTGPCHYLNVMIPTAQQAIWLANKNPQYLTTYPSQAKVLARHCIENHIKVPNLLQMIAHGETVDDELRELCYEAWDAKVINVYSSVEFGAIAIQCPTHNHLHAMSENVYIEILDNDNKPCPIGVPGRVVITTLHNLATPLIRYEIGDIAQFGAPCECGRNGLQVIDKVLGRYRHRLIYPDGSSHFPYLGNREDRAHIDVKANRFQVVQHDVHNIEFKLALAEPMTPENERLYLEWVKSNLGEQFNIRLTFHDELLPDKSGKFEEFISLVDPESIT